MLPSVQVWPGAPRMIRFELCEAALEPEQENCALLFAPKGLAVMGLLPGVTDNPTEPMPHSPPQA